MMDAEGSDGIGVFLSKATDRAAIDVDHCVGPDGAGAPWAEQFCELAIANGVYVEATIGNKGFRAIGRTREAEPVQKHNR